jgi:hypothetical protein
MACTGINAELLRDLPNEQSVFVSSQSPDMTESSDSLLV